MTMRKIGKIETFLVPPRWLFVRVEGNDGAFGWGEASLEGWAEAVEGAFEPFRDRFIGTDPFRIEDIWQVGYRGGFYRGGPVLMSALSGLEQALWDLKGRVLGLPAWQMLGGRVRDKVRSYAWIGGDRPHEISAAAKGRKEQGAVDIIQPDLSHAGGILEVRKIAAMAEAYDIAVAPHCPLGPLALGACLQIAACTPNHAIQEISLGIHYNTGGHDLLNFCVNKEALTPVDGYLPVPEGPGLGIEIDEAAVRAADKDKHRWRNPIWRNADGSFAEW